MYTGIADRLSLYIGRQGMTEKEFLMSCGLSTNVISKARATGNMTERSIFRIGERFPDLNLDWLRYNRGDMLLENVPAKAGATDSMLMQNLYERLLDSKDREIERLQDELDALREQLNHQALA